MFELQRYSFRVAESRILSARTPANCNSKLVVPYVLASTSKAVSPLGVNTPNMPRWLGTPYPDPSLGYHHNSVSSDLARTICPSINAFRQGIGWLWS
jgi:hypothetical protein